MGTTFAIAGIQMKVSSGKDNRKKFLFLTEKIVSDFPWIDLIMSSELSLLGDDINNAEKMPGPTVDELCNLAAKNGKWLLPGSLYEKENDKIFNTSVIISPEGKIVTKYRKIFPWRPIEKYDRGNEFCVFDIPNIGRFGLSICYDQWFPELVRTLAWKGAEVILHPTMTTTSDRDIELSLSQAHAAFNQLYFISINGVGNGGNGKSILVGPDGRVLQKAGSGETILTEIIDLDRVSQVRKRGTMGLCHPLKEICDISFEFPPYKQGLSKGKLVHYSN